VTVGTTLTVTGNITCNASSVSVGKSGTSGKFSATATNGTDSGFIGFVINQFQISTTNSDGIVFASNVCIGGVAAASYGGGTHVVNLQNCSVAPTTNPTNGGILYAQAGALKWRGSAGTITTIATA
jgi:hypothetical protein